MVPNRPKKSLSELQSLLLSSDELASGILLSVKACLKRPTLYSLLKSERLNSIERRKVESPFQFQMPVRAPQGRKGSMGSSSLPECTDQKREELTMSETLIFYFSPTYFQ